MDYPYPIEDRQLDYFGLFDARIRRHLAHLVSDEVIAEHAAKPLGQHSDALDRLLNYFRRGGLAGKYGILKPDPGVELYHIVVFSGARGERSQVLDDTSYGSLNSAYHAVFLRRVAELQSCQSKGA